MDQNLEELIACANSGDPIEQTKLALFYRSGDGVPIDLNRSFQLLHLAAKQSDPRAIYHLGLCYEEGLGVERDRIASNWFYRLSLALGYTEILRNHSMGWLFTLPDPRLEACIDLSELQQEVLDSCLKKATPSIYMQELLEQAQSGNPTAQSDLGVLELMGEARQKNTRDAFELFSKAAKQGDVVALNQLGRSYGLCLNGELDFEKSEAYYEQAIDKGYIGAMTNLGTFYTRSHKPDLQSKGLELLREAANQGHASAQEVLAKCLGDSSEAQFWLEKAADQGFPSALNKLGELRARNECNLELRAHGYRQGSRLGYSSSLYLLARCYLSGIGVEADPHQAFTLYKLASVKEEIPLALCDVGNCYQFGIGVKANPRKAFEWYKRAANQSNPEGLFRLGLCYSEGSGTEKNLTKAIDCITKAAHFENKEAQYYLGECYLNGNGIEKNVGAAVYWLNKAAERNYPQAQFTLGKCYEEGKGVKQDLERAVKLYQKAAQQSDALALFRLGVCYQMGKGVDRDEFTAADFYQKASSQGHPIAMFNLAVCLLRGIGVKKNTAEGEFWMNMAANTGLPRAHNYLSSIRSSDASFRNLAISTLKENLEDFAELGYADAIDDLKKRDPS